MSGRLTLETINPRYREFVAAQISPNKTAAILSQSCASQEIVTFDLPYPPSANRYWRFVGSRVHVSTEAKKYKISAAQIARQSIAVPFSGPVGVRLIVYRPRKIGDLDNTLKVLFDAIAGVAYHNDSQIEEINARRSDDKKNPRVSIEIRRIKDLIIAV